jgi:hypothetical protein
VHLRGIMAWYLLQVLVSLVTVSSARRIVCVYLQLLLMDCYSWIIRFSRPSQG